MRAWLRARPWIWLVLLYLAVVAVNAAVVWIAERHPVTPAGEAPLPPD